VDACTTWRRSSYSDSEGQSGDCVEVAFTGSGVAVRDSKRPGGGALTVSPVAWGEFVAAQRPTRAP
jgi:hypothetical protein